MRLKCVMLFLFLLVTAITAVAQNFSTGLGLSAYPCEEVNIVNNTGSLTQSLPCSDTSVYGQVRTQFASANANANNLGVYASSQIGEIDPNHAEGFSTAAVAFVTDILTFGGGSGSGYIVFNMHIGGSAMGSTSTPPFNSAWVNQTGYGETVYIRGVRCDSGCAYEVRHSEPMTSFEENVSKDWSSVPLPITFGNPNLVDMMLYANASVGSGSDVSIVADFSNTGTISSITLFDSNMQQLSNGSVQSSSGAVYRVNVPPYVASVQQPINPEGSSVFKANRGVVPVKFSLTYGGTATCNLPPATISIARTSGADPGPIDESAYLLPSDIGSNFRIDSCQYIYNLATGMLGTGNYVAKIWINGNVVGSATFGLR